MTTCRRCLDEGLLEAPVVGTDLCPDCSGDDRPTRFCDSCVERFPVAQLNAELSGGAVFSVCSPCLKAAAATACCPAWYLKAAAATDCCPGWERDGHTEACLDPRN